VQVDPEQEALVESEHQVHLSALEAA